MYTLLRRQSVWASYPLAFLNVCCQFSGWAPFCWCCKWKFICSNAERTQICCWRNPNWTKSGWSKQISVLNFFLYFFALLLNGQYVSKHGLFICWIICICSGKGKESNSFGWWRFHGSSGFFRNQRKVCSKTGTGIVPLSCRWILPADRFPVR